MTGITRRVAAVGAAVCVLGGTVAVIVAVLAGPGPGLTGYVSEAGVAGSAYAPTYRAGMFVLAGGLLLLAGALPAGLRPAGVLLLVAGLCTLVSGAVTCSGGCPLPPFERATTADLVHGAASVLAVATVVFAMVTIVCSPTAGARLRAVSAVGALLALPLAGAVGLAMLLDGRGTMVGVLERLLLAVGVGWGVTTAALLTRPRP